MSGEEKRGMRRDTQNVVFAAREDMNQMYEGPQEEERWTEERLPQQSVRRRRQREGLEWAEGEQESCSYICVLLV